MSIDTFRCSELAAHIRSLIEASDSSNDPPVSPELFQFTRVVHGQQTPSTALDSLGLHNGVTPQTVSTLHDDGEVRGDSRSIESGVAGGRSRPDQTVSVGDGVDGVGSTEPGSTERGGARR